MFKLEELYTIDEGDEEFSKSIIPKMTISTDNGSKRVNTMSA